MKYQEAIEAADLTELQRKYLELYLAGHRIRTIARAHGVKAGTVRGHIDAALDKIRKIQEAA